MYVKYGGNDCFCVYEGQNRKLLIHCFLESFMTRSAKAYEVFETTVCRNRCKKPTPYVEGITKKAKNQLNKANVPVTVNSLKLNLESKFLED